MARNNGVKQYVVGDKSQGADFSLDEIELLIYRIRDWFASDACDRNYNDPEAMARQKIQECLLAENDAGEPWRGCPQDFAARIKIKCLYDMNTNKGIPVQRVKAPMAVRKLNKEAQRAKMEIKKAAAIKFDHEQFREEKELAILKDFPELDNETHRPLVRRLSFLYAQQQVIDDILMQDGVSDGRRDVGLKLMQTLGKDIETTQKLLGVHPDQLRQRVNTKTQGAVSELVALLENDQDFKERIEIWSMQLALQLWWMTQHPNGRGDGPQLEEWEMWHMTRTRPVKFTCEHGTEYTVIDGFTPEELKAYLIRKGVLVHVPVLPQIIDKDVIADLETYGDPSEEDFTDTDISAALVELMDEEET